MIINLFFMVFEVKKSRFDLLVKNLNKIKHITLTDPSDTLWITCYQYLQDSEVH